MTIIKAGKYESYMVAKRAELTAKGFLIVGEIRIEDEKLTELYLVKGGRSWTVRFNHINIEKTMNRSQAV